MEWFMKLIINFLNFYKLDWDSFWPELLLGFWCLVQMIFFCKNGLSPTLLTWPKLTLAFVVQKMLWIFQGMLRFCFVTISYVNFVLLFN